MARIAPELGEVFQGFHDPRRYYTQIPDYLLDFLLPELSGSELKVVYYVARHTFGFLRDDAAISWSRFLDGTVSREGKRLDWGAGVSRRALKESLDSLIERGMLVKERQRSVRRGDEASLYSLHLLPHEEEEPPRDLDGHWGFRLMPHSTGMPNQLFDVLLPHLTEGELKTISYIIRRTLGMKRESAEISYSQFTRGITTEDGRVLDRGTGLSERTVQNALSGLITKRCIKRLDPPPNQGPGATYAYRLRTVDESEQQEAGSVGGRQEVPNVDGRKYHTGVEKDSTKSGQEVSHGGSRRYHREEEKGSTGEGSRNYHTAIAENSTHEKQYLNTVKDSLEKQQQPSTDVTVNDISSVVVALVDLGITKKIARDLAVRYTAELIHEQIDMLPYRQADNPPAVLVKAIREEWAPPAGYQTPEQREAQEAELVALRQDQMISKESEGRVQPRRQVVEFRPFQGIGLDSRRAWATALMSLKGQDGAEAYLSGTQLLARDGDELVVGTGTAYAAEWLQRRIAHRAAQLLSALGGERVAVRFVAETDWRGRKDSA